MDIIDLIPSLLLAFIGLLLLKISVFVLDFPIMNNWLGLDRERKKVAEELKLSLTKDRDREDINRNIALKTLSTIVYIIYACGLLYMCFKILPDINQLLSN